MPSKIRKLPGVAAEAARILIDSINALVDETDSLRRRPRTTPLQRSGYVASEGETVRLRGGQRVTLPRARPENTGAQVFVMLETAGTATVAARQSSVNGDDAVSLAFVGLYVFESNGAGGWFGTGLPIAEFVSSLASTSVVASGSTLERAALSGAVSAAQNSNSTTFSGIRANGVLQTAQPFLNFVNQTHVTFSLVQDAPNSEIEVRAGFLGSFYNENGVGSYQTPFISYDDSATAIASVTDNTGGSGYVNITFEVDQAAAFSWAGWHQMASRASAAAVTSGFGAYWVSGKVPMFTDDLADDYALVRGITSRTADVTSTSTVAAVVATRVVDANSTVAGTTFRLEGFVTYTKTAVNTTDPRFFLQWGGSNILAIQINQNANAGTFLFHVRGMLTIRTLGATGTYAAGLCVLGGYTDANAATTDAVGPQPARVDMVSGSVDTTAANTLSLAIALEGAVASNSITGTIGTIERVHL